MQRWFRSTLLSLSLLAGVIGCSTDSTEADASDDEETSEEALGVGTGGTRGCAPSDRIDEAQAVALMVRVGFPTHELPKLVCAIRHESNFCRTAQNRNTNGSGDRGLFQINDVHLADPTSSNPARRNGTPGCPSMAEAAAGALFDNEINARCALAIYRMQGLRAWYGYRNHQAECDAHRLGPAASAAASGGLAPGGPAVQPEGVGLDFGSRCRCDGVICICS